jgi:hypothetical protein
VAIAVYKRKLKNSKCNKQRSLRAKDIYIRAYERRDESNTLPSATYMFSFQSPSFKHV